jgi:O-antigen/teichoic acid export membrane protein
MALSRGVRAPVSFPAGQQGMRHGTAGSSSAVPRSAGFGKFVSGAGMLAAARVAGDLTSALLFVAVSRVHGAEGVGLYAYGFAIAQIVQFAVSFGLVDYGMREYARAEPGRRGRLLGNALGIQAALVLVAGVAVAAHLWATAASAQAVLLISAVVAYQILHNFVLMLNIPSISAQHMAGPAIAEFVFRGGGTLAAAALVLWGVPLPLALTALLGGVLGLFVAVWRMARRHDGAIVPRLDREIALPMLRPASVFAASTVVSALCARIGLILVVFLDGKAAAGVFATALKLVDVGMAPLLLLGVAVFPRLARSFAAEQTDLAVTIERYVRVSSALGALVFWGMVFVAPPLLPHIFGPDFADAGPTVRLMGVAAFLTALDHAAYRLLWTANLQARRLLIQGVGLTVTVVLGLALIPVAGAIGAIAATIAAMSVMLALAAVAIVRSMPDVRWGRLASGCLLPAGAVALCALAAHLAPWAAACLSLGVLCAALLPDVWPGRATAGALRP